MGHGVDRNETADGSGAAVTPLQLTLFTAKGDLAAGTANGAVDNLAVGANDTILMAASGEATGLKWATPNEVAAAVANGATAETAPAVADKVALYDASAGAGRTMTLANLLKVIDLLTAETAPATGDKLALYDADGASTDSITLENLLKVVNALTEDTSPDKTADYVLTYDASASGVKKVLLRKAAGIVSNASESVGTSATKDVTGLPAGIKKLVISIDVVSTNGTSDLLLQLGVAAGVTTSGYLSHAAGAGGTGSGSTAGFLLMNGTAATDAFSGTITLTRHDPSSHIWLAAVCLFKNTGTDTTAIGSGVVTLAGELDRFRLTTVGGSDVFDGGTVNYHYEM